MTKVNWQPSGTINLGVRVDRAPAPVRTWLRSVPTTASTEVTQTLPRSHSRGRI